MEYEATGLFYEEFEEGRAWKTAARTIGESDVNAFSALTGDYTYLHTRRRLSGKPRAARTFLSHGPGDQCRAVEITFRFLLR